MQQTNKCIIYNLTETILTSLYVLFQPESEQINATGQIESFYQGFGFLHSASIQCELVRSRWIVENATRGFGRQCLTLGRRRLTTVATDSDVCRPSESFLVDTFFKAKRQNWCCNTRSFLLKPFKTVTFC